MEDDFAKQRITKKNLERIRYFLREYQGWMQEHFETGAWIDNPKSMRIYKKEVEEANRLENKITLFLVQKRNKAKETHKY